MSAELTVSDLVKISNKDYSLWELYKDASCHRIARNYTRVFGDADWREFYFDGLLIMLSEPQKEYKTKRKFVQAALNFGRRGKNVAQRRKTFSSDGVVNRNGKEFNSFSVLPSKALTPERILILKEMVAEYFRLTRDSPELTALSEMLVEGLDPISISKETGMSLVDIMKRHREITGLVLIDKYFNDVSDAT